MGMLQDIAAQRMMRRSGPSADRVFGRHSSTPALSNARVPCVSIFCPQHPGAQAFAELFEAVSDREAGDVFDVLVAELAGNAHAQRSTEWHRQLAAVHTVADESLWVQRLSHVDAIPYLGLDRAVHNVSGLGQRPHQFQDV